MTDKELGLDAAAGGLGMSCAGKVALVTGGSKGLGRSMAMALASAGAVVAICGRNRPTLDETVSELEAMGAMALGITCDLSSPDAVRAMAEQVETELGTVDVLVNNAGGAPPPNEFLSTSLDTFLSTLRTNVGGALFCARAFGEKMVSRGAGSVINISSVGGVAGNYGDAVYNATKTAMMAMTKALAVEWAPNGVRVNAILPGFFPTDMNREHWENDPDLWNTLLSHVPLGRHGGGHDLDAAVVYLASEWSSFVTGSAITVDGGQLAVIDA